MNKIEKGADDNKGIPLKKDQQTQELRRRVERIIHALPPEDLKDLTLEQSQRMLFELQVHQVELSIQNEELRASRVELEESQARYFELYDLAPVGYLTVNEKGLMTLANLTVATLLGVERNTLINKPLSRYILKEDQDIFYSYRKILFESGKDQQCELRMVKADGEEFWARIQANLMQDEAGELQCRVVLSDISERKQAEEQLQFQAQIIENSLTIAAYHDKDLNVLWMNSAYEKAIGLSLEECKGRKCYQVWNLSKPCRGCPVITAIKTGEKANFELTPANQDHWPETQGCWISEASPVRDEQGNIIGALELAIDITERKTVEEALEKSEKQLSDLLNNMTEAVWSISWPDFRHNYLNPSLEKLYGRSRQEFYDNPSLFKEVTHPEDQHLTEKAIEQLLEKGQAIRECRILKPDGSIIWINDRSKLIYDENHQPIRVEGLSRDITERKEAEERLEQEKNEKELIINNLAEQVALIDPEMRIIWANSKVIERHNLRDVEYQGQKCYELYHQLSEPCPDCPIVDVFKTGVAGNGIHRSPDGRYWQVTGIPVTDNDGKMVGVLDTALDISDLILAQQALQESEARFQRMLKVIPDMISIHDPAMSIVYSNWAGFAAVPPEKQVLNTKCYKTYRDYDQICPDCQAVSVLDSKEAFQGEFELSEGYWIDLRVFPLLDKSGEVEYFIEWVRDISSLKQIEDQLKQFNIALDKKVEERTAELEAVNTELTSFAYSISHDFRAPLRALNAFSTSLTEKYNDQLDEEGLHYLNRIHYNALYMSDLVDDLLKLSRITRTEVKEQNVELSQVAEEIIKDLQEAEPGRQVTVKVAPGLLAKGDFTLLKAALENLIGNAWKFSSKEKQAAIEVGRSTVDGEEGFFVRDNGVGFDLAYADKLFGAFQRLHRADDFPGTGIGLATVQRIINRHGGRIWAESEEGKGATFYFTLKK